MEDKVPQTLKSFVAETDQPLTLGILLDTSGSQQRVLPLEQQAGSQFLEQVLRTKDEAFLLSFDVNVDLLQDFTNSPHVLARAMDKAQINTAGGNGAAGIPGLGGGPVPTIGDPKGTLLYDAIYLAANREAEPGDRPQGDDHPDRRRGRGQPYQDRRGHRRRATVQRHRLRDPDRRPRHVLEPAWAITATRRAKKISDETGGRLIDVGNNGNKLEAAFQQIEDELRTQYVATYTPSNTKLDGTFRHIAVDCPATGDNLKVQVRKGYYAPSPGR